MNTDDEVIKNGLVGQLMGWRIHGKSYDANWNEIDEKHEEDCACCCKDLFNRHKKTDEKHN